MSHNFPCSYPLRGTHLLYGQNYVTWQSRVEIKGYSCAHFDCIAVFEVPYR